MGFSPSSLPPPPHVVTPDTSVDKGSVSVMTAFVDANSCASSQPPFTDNEYNEWDLATCRSLMKKLICQFKACD